MARYLYSELASTLDAYKRCISASANDMQRDFADTHKENIDAMMNHMPHGGGFDCGTKLDFDASHAEKLVFTTSFHHMNETGYYDGWTEHIVTVTPSFLGFNLRVSGRNRNDIKEYVNEQFHYSLMTEV